MLRVQGPEAAVTKNDCAREIVAALNDLVEDLKKLAGRYSDPTERDYRAGIVAAAHYVNGCMAAVALTLPVKAEGEVVQ